MRRPWLSCNLAISADGKISSVDRRASTWTSAADRARLQALRRPAQALLVGRGTLERDRMTLCVADRDTPSPLRCIVSHHGDLSPDHPIFHRSGGDIHLLATGEARTPSGLPLTLHHQSLADFLETLASGLGVEHVHCEGGGQLIASLAALDAIDEIHLTWAGHTLYGGTHAPTLCGVLGIDLSDSRRYTLHHFQPDPQSGECFLSYRRLPAQ